MPATIFRACTWKRTKSKHWKPSIKRYKISNFPNRNEEIKKLPKCQTWKNFCLDIYWQRTQIKLILDMSLHKTDHSVHDSHCPYNLVFWPVPPFKLSKLNKKNKFLILKKNRTFKSWCKITNQWNKRNKLVGFTGF